jgi:hypothetical protein
MSTHKTERGTLSLRRSSQRRRIRAASLVAVATVALIVSASATAAPPTTVHVGPDQFAVALDAGALCEFPISWNGTQQSTTTTHYESDGTTVAMRITQGTEQDTFSANGKTLVGDEYHFTLRALFENGQRVARYEYGNVDRVPLAGGAVFLSTGRVLVDSSPANVFFVDEGNNANNIAAFCAALS